MYNAKIDYVGRVGFLVIWILFW